jgi:integrase
MPFKEEMNWDASKRRWHRMHKGEMYRISPKQLDADKTLKNLIHAYTRDGSRAAANEWWQRKQAELDGLRAEPVLGRLQTIPLDELQRLADPMTTGRQEIAARILASLGQDTAGAIATIIGERLAGKDEETKASALEDLGIILDSGREEVPLERTIKACAGRWLAVIRGEVAPSSYRELAEFANWLMAQTITPGGADVALIDGGLVESMYLCMKGQWSDSRRVKRWGFFCRFVRYLWGKGLIPLPTNLDQFTFRQAAKAVRRYPLGTVRGVLAKLSDRLKCYAFLALNTGMTNVDVGKLRHDMVDLGAGTLTRCRVKTEGRGSPTVTYRLWPETRELLRQFRSSHPVYFLTSKAGTPLYESRQVGEDVRHKDLVSKHWRGKDGRAKRGLDFKAFRSIGATELESHRDYGRCAVLYLAHSPKSIKDRHYAAPAQELFDEALTWLRGQILGK